MAYETIVPMWQAVRDRFMKRVEAIPEEDFELKLGDASIGALLYHTGEVEYIFSDWYFGKVNEQTIEKPTMENKAALISFLEESNAFLDVAMKELPEAEWAELKESKMGASTPAEVIARLIYHCGIHVGQITDIQKHGVK